MTEGFAPITLKAIEGKKTIKGELVLESHTAYQVAVDGHVDSYYKTDWTPLASFDQFNNIFGGMFA